MMWEPETCTPCGMVPGTPMTQTGCALLAAMASRSTALDCSSACYKAAYVSHTLVTRALQQGTRALAFDASFSQVHSASFWTWQVATTTSGRHCVKHMMRYSMSPSCSSAALSLAVPLACCLLLALQHPALLAESTQLQSACACAEAQTAQSELHTAAECIICMPWCLPLSSSVRCIATDLFAHCSQSPSCTSSAVTRDCSDTPLPACCSED